MRRSPRTNHSARRWFESLILLTFMLSPMLLAKAQDAGPVRVLVLTDFDLRTGPFVTVANSFSRELLALEDRPLVFRYVDLNAHDQAALSATDVQSLLIDRLFTSDPPDLVVALGPPSVEFWRENHEPRFEDVPVLACAAEVGGIDPEYIADQYAVISRFSFDGQIADILRLMPDIRHVFMVYGASRHERKLGSVAERQVSRSLAGVQLETSNDMEISEIERRVAELREGSIVYYVALGTDVSGQRLPEQAAFDRIQEVSRVPIFGPFDSQLGQGIVGGRLIQLELTGQMLAQKAYRILNDRAVPRGIEYVDLSEPQYDWRELQEWSISRARIPEDSRLAFQPRSAWDLYRGWIVAIVALISLQTWVIIQWFVQRRRSRLSSARVADLSRRLITAHEEERRLIARELHDDLSQRLARLSIDASLVMSLPGDRTADERLLDLQDDLSAVSKDVHELSYRLHPSLLEDLGLANALKAEVSRMQRHTDARIELDVVDAHVPLPLPIQLSVYRIGQEALHNAIRHSGARRIGVRLKAKNSYVELTVDDDGRGFTMKVQDMTFSLGLASMRERAILAEGTLAIHTHPGRGTRISLRVPTAADRS